MENISTLEKVLLLCNRNAELLRLVGATFKSGFAQKDEEEKFDNSEKLAEKRLPFFFYLFVVVEI